MERDGNGLTRVMRYHNDDDDHDDVCANDVVCFVGYYTS